MKFFRIIGMFLLAAHMMASISGCSSRTGQPLENADNTIIYPPKNADDISANIILCRKISKTSGKPIGAGTTFEIRDKENLRALIQLQNREKQTKDLWFHVDWIGPNGKSFFLKSTILHAADSASDLNSSVSISPELRQPGEYRIKLYLFRELIAEKIFTLIPDNGIDENEVKASIILCRKIDKETGLPVEIDSSFRIRKKGKMNAIIDLTNLNPDEDDRELKFRLEWSDDEGNAFFKKKVDFIPTDTIAQLTSSISITPEKREAGVYWFRIYQSNKVLAERRFELYH